MKCADVTISYQLIFASFYHKAVVLSFNRLSKADRDLQAKEIIFSKSVNCMINACRVLQMRLVVNTPRVSFDISTLTCIDRSGRQGPNPELNPSPAGSTFHPSPD